MKDDEEIDLFYNFKTQPVRKPPSKKPVHKKKKKKTKSHKILRFIILSSLFIGGLIAFLLSPLFTIQEIIVENNNQIETQTIIDLSEIQISGNVFKISKGKTIKNIKTNAYVDSVKIKRKLPNKIVIHIEERYRTFQIKTETGYVYINNQGYILEISDVKLEVPEIAGITENLEIGKRIIEEDLQKLEQVLKIIKSAANKQIEKLITRIDITDKNNYTLLLETEGKEIHLGDASNIDTKFAYIKYYIENEKGKNGKIFVNVDLNKNKYPYFREE